MDVSILKLKYVPISLTLMPILDIREEFEFHHLPPLKEAYHYPMSKFPSWVKELDKNKTYHIICRSGNRSRRVVSELRKMGFDAKNVEGGMLKSSR